MERNKYINTFGWLKRKKQIEIYFVKQLVYRSFSSTSDKIWCFLSDEVSEQGVEEKSNIMGLPGRCMRKIDPGQPA